VTLRKGNLKLETSLLQSKQQKATEKAAKGKKRKAHPEQR